MYDKNKLHYILLLSFSWGVTMFGASNTTPNTGKTPATGLAHKQAVTSKTAYYSMEKVLSQSKELQDAVKPLQKKLKEAEEEIGRQNTKLQTQAAKVQKMRDDLGTKRTDYDKKKKLASNEALESLEREMAILQSDLSEEEANLRKGQEALRQNVHYIDMQAMQEEQRLRKPIIEKIIKIAADTLALMGWDAILPIEVPVNERVDLTDEITHELNKTYKPVTHTTPTAPKPKVQTV